MPRQVKDGNYVAKNAEQETPAQSELRLAKAINYNIDNIQKKAVEERTREEKE